MTPDHPPAAPPPATLPIAVPPPDALPLPGPPATRARRVAIPIILLCILTEGVLLGADWGLWGNRGWRPLSYQYGAFWAGLLHGWQPNYRLQPALMFVSHAFLHAGPVHLIGNMLAIGGLVHLSMDRISARGFAALYLVAALGGAVAFGLLASSPAPMVGASGAIFGLAGAAAWWTWTDRRAQAMRGWQAVWPLLAITGCLILFNAITWALQNGNLAWEAHLGGFLAGLGYAALRRQKQALCGPKQAL